MPAKYDLCIARWGLGYLNDKDVEIFLKRCHPFLIKDRKEGKYCPMIFFETIKEEDGRIVRPDE